MGSDTGSRASAAPELARTREGLEDVAIAARAGTSGRAGEVEAPGNASARSGTGHVGRYGLGSMRPLPPKPISYLST